MTNVNTALQSTGLRMKALTVRLKRTMYVPAKQDKAATAVVASTMNCSKKAGKYTKALLRGCKELKDCQHAFQDVYKFVNENTLPWMDDGVRVLPNENYLDFTAELGRLKAKCEAAADRLEAVWDTAILADKAYLGNMFDPSDYPDAATMRAKWSVSVMYAPVPDSRDFRIDMDECDKKALDDAIAEVERGSTTYLLEQLLAPVSAMVEKLNVPIGQEGSIFRDTLVSNIHSICERAKKLNINHDNRVDEIVSEMEHAMKHVDASSLRESQVVRATTAKQMEKIQEKLNQWF